MVIRFNFFSFTPSRKTFEGIEYDLSILEAAKFAFYADIQEA